MRPGVVLGLLGGTCVLLAAVLVLIPRERPDPATRSTTSPDGPSSAPAEPEADRRGEVAAPESVAAEEPAPATVTTTDVAVTTKAAKILGRLCLVIDDAGYALDDLAVFLEIPAEITVAVIPGLANSAEAARRVRSSGKTLFLHVPMEPEGGEDPGDGAIRTDMADADIRRALGGWLDEVGPVAGLNNHMGSRATADLDTVRSVLAVARERDLLFLDSRTTARSVVAGEARRLGVPVAERDVFLDDEPGMEPIDRKSVV